MSAPFDERACVAFAASVPAFLDDRSVLSSPVATHVESCLRCQAELARHRRVLRLLGELPAEEHLPPAGLVTDVLGALGGAARRQAVRAALRGRRVEMLGAVAIGLLAATGIVCATRARHARGLRAGKRRAITSGA